MTHKNSVDGAGMTGTWHILPVPTTEALAPLITAAFRHWHEDCFRDSQAAHPSLAVELRDLRPVAGWWLGHLLTPIALYRICIPTAVPTLPLPSGWTPRERAIQPCLALGPLLALPIPGLIGQGHLHYLPELGHFLLQPEVQGLRRYPDADAVFSAWDQVLSFRQQTRANLEKQQQCDRRAFLQRLMPIPKDSSL